MRYRSMEIVFSIYVNYITRPLPLCLDLPSSVDRLILHYVTKMVWYGTCACEKKKWTFLIDSEELRRPLTLDTMTLPACMQDQTQPGDYLVV